MANAKSPSSARPLNRPDADEAAPTLPVARVQYGQVNVALWHKTVNGKNGKGRDTVVATVTRSYKDGTEYKRTNSLFPEDFLAASHALSRAYEIVQNGLESTEE